MKNHKLMAVIAVAVPSIIATMPATAADLGNGVTVSGDFQYMFSRIDTGNDSFGLADIGLSWRADQSGAFGFGADFELSSAKDFDGSSTVSDTQIWGGAVVSTSFGELTLGNPRPRAGQISVAPILGNAGLHDRDLGLQGLSNVSFLDILSVQANGTSPSVYGAGFAGSSGALSYSIAMHRAENDVFLVDATEITLAYKSGAVHLYGAVETYDFGTTANRKSLIGANYTLDAWELGVEQMSSDLSGFDASRVMAYGTFAVNESVDLSLQVGSINDSADVFNTVGVSGTYAFESGAYVSAGYLSAKNTTLDKAASLTLGFTF